MNFDGDLMGVREFKMTSQLFSRYANKVEARRLNCFFCGAEINVGDKVVSRQSKNPENTKNAGLPSTRRVLYHRSCAEAVLII